MIKTIDNLYFTCDECPICLDFEHRKKIANILNEDIQLEYCSCDKIGAPFYIGGYCEDAWSTKLQKNKNKNKNKKRDRNYYRETKKAKFKRKELMSEYCDFVFWMGPNNNYIMYPKNSKIKRFYKKISNKKVRQNNFICGNYSNYRKFFDYKWSIS